MSFWMEVVRRRDGGGRPHLSMKAHLAWTLGTEWYSALSLRMGPV